MQSGINFKVQPALGSAMGCQCSDLFQIPHHESYITQPAAQDIFRGRESHNQQRCTDALIPKNQCFVVPVHNKEWTSRRIKYPGYVN